MNSKRITKIEIPCVKSSYSMDDLHNVKEWTIKRILCEIWFFENEETRRQIEKIIFARKDGKVLFIKTLNSLVDNKMIVSSKSMELFKKHSIDCPNKPHTDDGKYVMEKNDYDLRMGKIKLIEEGIELMGDVAKNAKEIRAVLLIHSQWKDSLKELPPKSNDSHASRKGIIVRRELLKKIRIAIEEIMYNYLDALGETPKTRSKILASSYIKSQLH